MGVITVVLLVIGAVWLVRAQRRAWVIVIVCATQVVFAVRVGGDWMLGARFLAPVAPQLVLLQVAGVLAAAGALDRVRVRWLRQAVVVSLSALLILSVGFRLRTQTTMPVWGGGYSNRSLIASNIGRGWVEGAALLRCASPGQLVAYSEMGYAGYLRQDLRFLDLHALVNKEIAKDLKPYSGKDDLADVLWYVPSTTVGSEVLKRRPHFVLSFDGNPPDPALDGRYIRVEGQRVGELDYELYRRADVDCVTG